MPALVPLSTAASGAADGWAFGRLPVAENPPVKYNLSYAVSIQLYATMLDAYKVEQALRAALPVEMQGSAVHIAQILSEAVGSESTDSGWTAETLDEKALLRSIAKALSKEKLNQAGTLVFFGDGLQANSINIRNIAAGSIYEISLHFSQSSIRSTRDTLSFSRFVVEEQIGEGSFATVYKAFDKRLKLTIALKTLRQELQLQERIFIREAKIISQLKHPNIIRVLDTGRDDESRRVYIAMNYVDGTNLEQLIIKEGRIPWLRTLSLLEGVCSALDYAHQEGIIHRDVKPSNILIDSSGTPYLADFGVAKIVSGTTIPDVGQERFLIGSAPYTAPELWDSDSEGNGSRTSDIYALACVVFEMLVGNRLFKADSLRRFMNAHTRGPKFSNSWPDDVPAGIEEVLCKALHKDPVLRFQSSASFFTALKELPLASKKEATAVVKPEIKIEESKSTKRMISNYYYLSEPSHKKQGMTNNTRLIIAMILTVMFVFFIYIAVVFERFGGLKQTSEPSITASALSEVQRASNVPIVEDPRGEQILSVSQTWPVVYYDNFDNNIAEWFEGAYSLREVKNGYINIREGQHQWSISTLKDTTWWLRPKKSLPEGFALSIEMKQVEGSSTNGYGVVFCLKEGYSYYSFMISDEKKFEVARVMNNQKEVIIPWKNAELVKPGEYNKLTVIAANEEYFLYINDIYLTRFIDESLFLGQLGIIVSMNANETALYHSDNFRLQAP